MIIQIKTGKLLTKQEKKSITGGRQPYGWCCGACSFIWGSELVTSRSCASVSSICLNGGGYLNDCNCGESCIP